MNHIYRSIWNDKSGTFVAASEESSSGGRKSPPGATAAVGAAGRNSRFALKALAVSLMLAFGSNGYALPTGGAVSAGSASIANGAGTTTINQSSQNVAINWQGFSIGSGEAVRFVQPNSSSAALNRVLGPDPSSILGSLSANGKVFLVNPNGILFGKGAQVNVGGLVASTRNIADGDFMAGNYRFAGSGGGTIVNQGSITADGGYVALLGANVSNEGVISARLGTVALAAGNAFTLDVAGDGLLNVMVNQGAVNALVQNGGLIRADGGQVLLTAQAAGNLLQSVVNNTGVIQAQTVENRNGTIRLMGDMQSGTVNVGGTLDASAPNGGNGGFIETSAAHVKVQDNARVTTAAPGGLTGTFLIDPQDFNIGIGGNIRGTTLAALLVTNSVVITTNTGIDAAVAGTPPVTTLHDNAAAAFGDINVNESIGGAAPSWTAVPDTTTLTLSAFRDVNINATIVATNGNLVVCCGRDVNVRAAITTTNGSVSLSAGNNVNLFVGSAMTTTNGNISLCAGHDVIVNSKIILTNSGSIPSQSLGLPLGLTLSAGNAATGPGAAGGSVFLPGPLDPLRPSVTRSSAPATDVIITYNPASYATPTDYLPDFIFVGAVTLTQNMLVFPGGADKTFDGTTTATFTGFKTSALSGPVPGGLTLAGAGTANFDTAAAGVGKTITFSGFTLGGASAGFALPVACCGPAVGRTTADITPAIIVVPVPPLVPIVPPVVPPLAVVTPPFSPPPVLAALEAPSVALAPEVPQLSPEAPQLAPEASQFAPQAPQLERASATLQMVPGVNLTVVGAGVRMPPIQLVETMPVRTEAVGMAPEKSLVDGPAEMSPRFDVPPPLPPRRDRN
jgi:filamentous hemagglutinin family protein